MKNVRNMLMSASMTGILLMGSTFANAGIIVAGFRSDSDSKQPADPCTTSTVSKKSTTGIIVTDGIIVAGIAGIIVAGIAGIIVTDAPSTPQNCGIIVAG